MVRKWKVVSFISACIIFICMALVSCNKETTEEPDGGGGDGKLDIKIVNNTAKTVSHLTVKDAASHGFDLDTPPYLYNDDIEIPPSGTKDVDFTKLGVFKGEPYDGNHVLEIMAVFTDDTKTNHIIFVVPTKVNTRLDCKLDP